MVLTSLAMAFLIGAVAESENVINIIVNVTVGSLFLEVFTPTSVLDKRILKFSRILPIYWYEEVNNLLAGFLGRLHRETERNLEIIWDSVVCLQQRCISIGMAVLK